MTRLEKYQFPHLNPDAIAALVQVKAEPAPSWNEAQVEQIRAQAYAQGQRDGQAAASESLEAQRVAALGAIERQVTAVGGQLCGLGTGLEKAAAALAYGIARLIAQDALDRDALGAIEPIVARCLSEITGAPRLVIQVHDSLVDAMNQQLTDTINTSGFAGRVQVTGGGSHPGDCRIEWPEGGMERQLSTILNDLENQYRAHGVAVPAAAPPHAEPGEEV